MEESYNGGNHLGIIALIGSPSISLILSQRRQEATSPSSVIGAQTCHRRSRQSLANARPLVTCPAGVSNYRINDVFHVSMLRKYIHDPSHVLEVLAIELKEDLTYEEQPIQILEWKDHVLRNKTLLLSRDHRRSPELKRVTTGVASHRRMYGRRLRAPPVLATAGSGHFPMRFRPPCASPGRLEGPVTGVDTGADPPTDPQ
ncbi:hypothetical protein FNV43_RR08797 [Rhamnella rubrinervis]|uniref:Uncharacterized protein n=1 Tax=Rhamnella rubrinervis TaxID=2594499 RepID=A0A8K0H9G0_9ROSA|nr:hypothetical protein FNV43_RR08797 [Rhamnella rubrinervis]